MSLYSSTMTAKDVKALASSKIPLDLHNGWSGSGGKILNETFSGLKGWKKRFFFLDRRAIPQAMAWRHHDSDIHDPLPTDGFHASDVVTLTNQSIDIRPVPSGLLFHAGLATTWEFSGFLPVFKDTEGNVVTMSEYLRFPFLDGATIEQGGALSARDAITQRTTGPLPVNQSLPEKTARLKEVEISDPKIVVIRERKARAAAKKRAERKRAADGEGGSKGKTKRRKVSAVRAEEEDSTEEASSASPLRTVAPNPSFLLKDVDDAGTAESREDEHVSVPRHDSANTSIHNYAADHDESFDESRGHGETVETHPADETRLTETPVPARNPEKTAVQDLVPVVRSNLAGDHADGAESSRPGSVYVPEWTIHRRSRVDTPEECRELAWFSIARGAMAQTDALLRFEALYDAHLALKERCEDVTRQLVSTRTDFTHVSNLYNTLSNRYQQVRGEHAGCAEKLINAERERDELRAVNADQASHIKELEAELARKDSALVFSEASLVWDKWETMIQWLSSSLKGSIIFNVVDAVYVPWIIIDGGGLVKLCYMFYGMMRGFKKSICAKAKSMGIEVDNVPAGVIQNSGISSEVISSMVMRVRAIHGANGKIDEFRMKLEWPFDLFLGLTCGVMGTSLRNSFIEVMLSEIQQTNYSRSNNLASLSFTIRFVDIREARAGTHKVEELAESD
ncbi:hypothetical protein Tco_0566554 [Tanacetum coccineum]